MIIMMIAVDLTVIDYNYDHISNYNYNLDYMYCFALIMSRCLLYLKLLKYITEISPLT